MKTEFRGDKIDRIVGKIEMFCPPTNGAQPFSLAFCNCVLIGIDSDGANPERFAILEEGAFTASDIQNFLWLRGGESLTKFVLIRASEVYEPVRPEKRRASLT